MAAAASAACVAMWRERGGGEHGEAAPPERRERLRKMKRTTHIPPWTTHTCHGSTAPTHYFLGRSLGRGGGREGGGHTQLGQTRALYPCAPVPPPPCSPSRVCSHLYRQNQAPGGGRPEACGRGLTRTRSGVRVCVCGCVGVWVCACVGACPQERGERGRVARRGARHGETVCAKCGLTLPSPPPRFSPSLLLLIKNNHVRAALTAPVRRGRGGRGRGGGGGRAGVS